MTQNADVTPRFLDFGLRSQITRVFNKRAN